MKTASETTIELQLKAMGFTCDVECIDFGGYRNDSKFQVTLYRNGVKFKTEYTSGWGNRILRGKRIKTQNLTVADVEDINNHSSPIIPNLTDIVCTLWADASCVCNGETFEDFCSALGHSPDSRKAETIYQSLVKTWQAFVRMGIDMEEMAELFVNY